jgi:mannose-1-phosphate guanylyltransferase
VNYAVILAGGAGTRFWPLSRKHLPKQFLRIVEKQSLIEATISRIRKIIPDERIFIITNKIYLGEIKQQLRKFNIPQGNIILEPSPRNTLPAIALCAQIIRGKDLKANLLISPSDHYIKDIVRFRKDIFKALNLAEEGFLCLIGIKPDSPRSGYGYIKTGKIKSKDTFFVDSFKEKPTPDEAKRIFGKKDIFWNSGIFCFKAKAILEEIKRYLPVLYHQISSIRNKQDSERIWPRIKPISIDYGLLEKFKNLVMVAAKFYWSDLGSWDALSDILPRDKRNNVVLSDCDCVSLDNSNTLVCSYGHKRLIAAVGLKDLIVVDTPDALLVCKKENAQDIKRLVELLKKRRRTCV